jgi:TonB family protein
VLAAFVPSDGKTPGSEYGLALFASHGTRVGAHVTLIGADGAYDASVSAMNLQGAAGDRRSDAVVVKFEKPVRIHYFFVDSFTIDGGASVTCPSYVRVTGEGPSQDATTGLGLNTVVPTFLQNLPDLPCGKAYTEPSIKRGYEAIVGLYGDLKRTTTLHVYVDSNGHEIRATVEKSSGVEGLDDAAMASVQQTTYHPAQFLCTPVVGEVEEEIEYTP